MSPTTTSRSAGKARPKWKRVWLAVILGIVTGVAILVGARNVLVRELVEWEVRKTTGFPLQIESFFWDLRSGWVYAHNLTLLNPPEFKDRLFADVQELYVELDWLSLLGPRPHIKNLLISINEIQIIKNADGTSNVTHLNGVSTPRPHALRQFQIDSVRLLLDTVRVKDYGRLIGQEKVQRLRIDETYHNITEVTAINRLLLYTIIKRLPLNLGLTLDQLTEGLGHILGLPVELLKGAAGLVGKAGQTVIDAVRPAEPTNVAEPAR